MKEIVSVLFISSLIGSLLSHGSNDACGGCRILTPLIKDEKAVEARSLSQADSQQFVGLTSHSGFITVKEQYNSNLFFWFFPAKTPLETTPWIIWLQGGPGFSSMLGLFNIGPLKIENGTVKYRNVSLASTYSVMFLDNPVGAGFSFTNEDNGYPDDVGAQMLEFLQQFLEMFPELRAAPLFLTGESYAGKYIPALGIQIHRNNVKITNAAKNVEKSTYLSGSGKKKLINLRGLIIGSGMIDPRSLMHYSKLVSALGLLEGEEVEYLRSLEESAVRLVDEGKMLEAGNKFNETIEFIKLHAAVNIYNFNENPPHVDQAPEFEAFVNRPDVRKALGAGNVTFNFNNQKVYEKMLPDIMNSMKPTLEELLEHYPVLCYHGQNDIIMAYSLAMNLYKTLQWSKRQLYIDSVRTHILDAQNNTLAYEKVGGNFAETLIRNVGHMVVHDNPNFATFLHYQFIEQHK